MAVEVNTQNSKATEIQITYSGSSEQVTSDQRVATIQI